MYNMKNTKCWRGSVAIGASLLKEMQFEATITLESLAMIRKTQYILQYSIKLYFLIFLTSKLQT